MERRHFQLEAGYLNIDDTALYFTRSGNWQEALATRERSKAQGPAHAGRRVIGLVIIILGGLILLIGHLADARDTGSTLVALSLTALGGLSLYRSLRHDFGPVFRIPFARLIALEGPEAEMLTVRFMNGDLAADQVTVKVPEQALRMMHEGFERSRR